MKISVNFTVDLGLEKKDECLLGKYRRSIEKLIQVFAQANTLFAFQTLLILSALNQ